MIKIRNFSLTTKNYHKVGLASVWMSLLVVGAAPGTLKAAEQYVMDAPHTAVVFRIKHLGMSYTYGRFNEVKGKFTIDSEDDGGSTFNVTIMADSIDTGLKKRDDHLRSPDFFNAKQFPVITFRSTSVESGPGGFNVTGDLSFHGKTHSKTLFFTKLGEGKDPWGNYRIGFTADLSIKRSEFGMTQMLEIVGDDVHLMISFEGLRQ